MNLVGSQAQKQVENTDVRPAHNERGPMNGQIQERQGLPGILLRCIEFVDAESHLISTKHSLHIQFGYRPSQQQL
jgi:hypothetical protein